MMLVKKRKSFDILALYKSDYYYYYYKNDSSSLSMFLTTQALSQPDVCTEHKQCYLASNISAKISYYLPCYGRPM